MHLSVSPIHPILSLLTLCLVLLGLNTSCSTHVLDVDGIHGYWQLARVDTLATGGTCDTRQSRIFWAIEGSLLQVSDQNYVLDAYLLRYQYDGEWLYVREPYLVDHKGADTPVSDAAVLAPYGIQGLQDAYDVRRLNDEHMTLQSGTLRLHFNRY